MDNDIIGQACNGIYRVTIYRDYNSIDPREWGTMFKLCTPKADGWSEIDMDDYMEHKCIVWNRRGGSHFAFPLFYSDHGPCCHHFLTSSNFKEGIGPWPHKQEPIGYGIVKMEDVKKELGLDDNMDVEAIKERAFDYWKHDVKLLDWYLNDEVYGYTIERLGEYVDSGEGFFGDDLDVVKESMSSNLGGLTYQYPEVIDLLMSIEYSANPEKCDFDEMEMLASFAA